MYEELREFAKGKPETINEKGGFAIIYNRVSSKDQLENRSLETQMTTCEEFARRNNYTIIEKFGGIYESAKSDIERKEFSRMLSYLKTTKLPIKAVIVYSTSRFSRTGSTTIIEDVERLGGMVLSATSNYDPKTAQGKFIQGMEIIVARLDNDIKAKTTIDNSTNALKDGRWVTRVPFGYISKTTKKEQIISITEDGEKLKKAFEWKANENITNEEILKRLESMGLKISKQKLSYIFKNLFYCSLISHSYLNGEVIKGNHPALITKELFYKVNNLLKKQHSNGYEIKNEKSEVPLIGTIKCPVCGGNLTSSISTKLKKKYNRDVHYYVCWKTGCKFNSSAKSVNQAYENTINNFGLSDTTSDLLKKQMIKVLEYMNKENTERIPLIKRTITKLKSDINIVEENLALAKDVRKEEVCRKMLTKYEEEKELNEVELIKIEKTTLNLTKYVEFGLAMKNNLLNIWQLGELNEKKKIQSLVFPKGLIYNKELCNIEPLFVNKFISIDATNIDTYSEKKNETKEENLLLSRKVGPLGLEPRTYGL
jgi:site-specific DNA recombinase